MDRQTRYADAGGTAIAYQVLGDGPRNPVVAPGFISHVELMWEQGVPGEWSLLAVVA